MQTLADYKRFFVEEGRGEGEENLSFCLDRMERNSSIKLNFVGKIGNLKKGCTKKGSLTNTYMERACITYHHAHAYLNKKVNKQSLFFLLFCFDAADQLMLVCQFLWS